MKQQRFTVKISKNQVFQNSNKILDAKLRINRRAGKENIQHKPVIVPSDLAKIRASPFLSLVLHSCKVRTEWPPTFRCRPQPQAFRVAFLTPVIFRATSRRFSAYRAALMTKSGKAYSDIRQKEVISGRFPITKSELARCWLRDEGPISHIRPAKQSRNEHVLRFRSWLRISVKIFAFFTVVYLYYRLQKIFAMPPSHGWPITTTT